MPHERPIDEYMAKFADKLRMTTEEGKVAAMTDQIASIVATSIDITKLAEVQTTMTQCRGIELGDPTTTTLKNFAHKLWFDFCVQGSGDEMLLREVLASITVASQLLDAPTKETFVAKVSAKRSMVDLANATSAMTANTDEAPNAQELEMRLAKLSRNVALAQQHLLRLKKLGIDDAGFDMNALVDKSAQLLNSKATATVEAFLKDNEGPISSLLTASAGNVKDSNNQWVDELQAPSDWPTTARDAENLVLSINKAQLDMLIGSVEAAHMRASSMVATFKVDIDLTSMTLALRRGRLLKAAFELFFSFAHEQDFGALRKLGKSKTDELVRHGLRATDFPPALQTRIEAAARMDRM